MNARTILFQSFELSLLQYVLPLCCKDKKPKAGSVDFQCSALVLQCSVPNTVDCQQSARQLDSCSVRVTVEVKHNINVTYNQLNVLLHYQQSSLTHNTVLSIFHIYFLFQLLRNFMRLRLTYIVVVSFVLVGLRQSYFKKFHQTCLQILKINYSPFIIT